ncbi:MAG: protein kinase [Deltaproteobacteria bacterium]|nr:protein kinase [Deltaproteobacteria bacterium]
MSAHGTFGGPHVITASGLIGQVLEGNYRLDELISRGANSLVFRGTHTRLGQSVAIKVLSADMAADPILKTRFEAEARVQASLRHPHIVAVQDFVNLGDFYAIIMEYFEGTTLDQVLFDLDGPMPLDRIRAVCEPVLEAIGYAHSQGVVHRDIKPSNIIIARIGSREYPKVMDFGIAKVLAESATQTAPGAMLGTLLYMSPEQCKALKSVDERSDIYSLGITLYQMATGMVPFYAESAFDIMMAHVQTPPPAPRSLVPQVPARLEQIILRALQKRPEDRFQSAAEMATALARLPLAEDFLSPAPPAASPPASDSPQGGSVRPGRSSFIVQEVRRSLPDLSGDVGRHQAEHRGASPSGEQLATSRLRQQSGQAPAAAHDQTLPALEQSEHREGPRRTAQLPTVASPADPSSTSRPVRSASRETPGSQASENEEFSGTTPSGARSSRSSDELLRAAVAEMSPRADPFPLGWDESRAQRLRLRVPSVDEWDRFYDPNIFGGGIFCPSAKPPEVGTPVRVEISFTSGPRFFVRGMVTWRRPVVKDPRTRAGVGVQVHPAERNKLAYVNSWARGLTANQRRRRRLPVKLRVAYSGRAGRRVNFTRDLNEEGIFIRSQELLDVDTDVKLLLMPPGGTRKPFTLRGKVTRQVEANEERGMGIELSFADARSQNHYFAFIAELERLFLAGNLPDEVIN